MKKLLFLGAIAAVSLAITGCSCPFFGDDKDCGKDTKQCEMKKDCDKCGKCGKDDKDCKCGKAAKCDMPAVPVAPVAPVAK